jgi:hypothetical protein
MEFIVPSPNLPFALYTFHFKTLEPLSQVQFSASFWHGQFGRALRSVVQCVQPQTECKQCMLLHNCDYSYLFYGARPLNASIMRQYETIPVPHRFLGDITYTLNLAKHDFFKVKLFLFGKAIKSLPIIINSMENIANSGLKRQRFKVQLESVSVQPDQGLESLVYNRGLALPTPEIHLATIPPCPAFIRLQWLTPYRAKVMRSGEMLTDIDSAKLMMAIIRRIFLLQSFYTDTPFTDDFTQLKKLSLKFSQQQLQSSLYFSKQSRHSSKHKRVLDTSGVIGHLDFSLAGMEALWAYLYLGQFTASGQNASLGFGHYQLLQVNR